MDPIKISKKNEKRINFKKEVRTSRQRRLDQIEVINLRQQQLITQQNNLNNKY